MIKLKINDIEIEIEDGLTVLDAAEKLDISIPTMCYRKDCTPFTSCMICVVKDKTSGKLLPACSAMAQEDMDINTDSEEVLASRQTALELLLSDHVGDCEAPCQRVCPANINIPAMLRHIKAGDYDKAASSIAQSTGSSDNPCEGCKCPCEKACRRNQHDSSVSIKLLVKYSLDRGKPRTDTASVEEFDFNCSMGRLIDGEMEEFLKHASSDDRIEPSSNDYTEEEAQKESVRCLHCDCIKQNNCLLRRYSDTYKARQRQYSGLSRKAFTQVRQHVNIIYEPEKCIKCGLCVQITERESETLGISFIGRGFDVKVGVPFNKTMDEALAKTAEQCVDACPTAALAFKDI